MADVAFLLLNFSFVAAAIRTETGTPVALPDLLHHGYGPTPTTLAVCPDGAAVTPEAAGARIAEVASDRLVVTFLAHRRTPYGAHVTAPDAVLLGHRGAGVAPRLVLQDLAEEGA
jgi:hypothetical protein